MDGFYNNPGNSLRKTEMSQRIADHYRLVARRSRVQFISTGVEEAVGLSAIFRDYTGQQSDVFGDVNLIGRMNYVLSVREAETSTPRDPPVSVSPRRCRCSRLLAPWPRSPELLVPEPLVMYVEFC